MKRINRRGFGVLAAGLAVTYTACRRDEPRAGSEPAPKAPPPASPTPPATVQSKGVPTRAFGRTSEQVSMIGLGGAHIGKGMSEDESIRLIRQAVDEGVTFMDNCWDYNDGDSEKWMGKALRDGYRKRVFLMTKLDGRTKESARAQLEQSLQRLQTDSIDLVQIHEVIRSSDPERCFGEQGAMAALIEARKAGKLRYIGFTGHKDPSYHLAMLKAADRNGFRFDAVQLPLNVMDAHYKSFEASVLPVLVEQGIAVLGMKSMGAGDILKSDVVKPEECLRYALSLPTSVVICGMDSPEVLKKNLQTARSFVPLSPAERTALLDKTRRPAAEGEHELFKTSQKYDGTAKNPHWLEEARL